MSLCKSIQDVLDNNKKKNEESEEIFYPEGE